MQQGGSLSNLYKVVESIEERLGGEARAIKALDLRKEIKFVKRLANESKKDQRHAPKPAEVVEGLNTGELGKANDYTHAIVRAYEQYMRSKGPSQSWPPGSRPTHP